MPDLNSLMAQMQSLFTTHDGPVDWQSVTDLARRTAAQEPDPTPSAAQSRRDRRRRTAGRPLARHHHRLPVRREHDRRVVARRLDRGDDRRLEGAGRADRRLRHRRRSARRCPRRCASSPDRSWRCSARPAVRWSPTRSAAAWARSPVTCSARPTSASRWAPSARRRCCRPTWRPSPRRSSTSPPTTSCSTSRCARLPTSGSSPVCRGCATTSSARSPSTAPAWTIDTSGMEAEAARPRHVQPRSHAGGPVRRALRPRALPGPEGRAGEARDHPRPGRGLGRRGGRPGHRRADARRGQAHGDRTPTACRRRTRRADLRHPGRSRAAAASTARGLDPVGVAAHPPGRRGPRRRVDVSAPAADRRRPRRPAGLPRGLDRPSGQLSEEEFDAGLRDLLDGDGGDDGPRE